MYNSVTNDNNKGFYIGRFEAGKENNKVVVKKDKQVYQTIWGNSMTDYQSGAVGAAFDFAKVTYAEKGRHVGVASTLVFGIQWDATMQFFDSNYINGVCDANSYVVRANGRGYGVGDCVNTGYYSMKNIYDMAGNVREWSMEASR